MPSRAEFHAKAWAVYSHVSKQRASRAARTMRQLRRNIEAYQEQAALVAVLIAVCSKGSLRRTIERAHGKWRGSTLMGYYEHGDEQTCRAKFHMTRGQLEGIVELMRGTGFDRAREQRGYKRSRTGNMTAKAFIAQDTPSLAFKVASCVYTLSQEGSVKTSADVASIGESTLRRWLGCFADAVRTRMKPLYMSGKPFSDEERKAVRDEFAVRRGMWGPIYACNGTHTPFHPKNHGLANDYRNYKGWTSILSVAFVDSFYRFVELSTGHVGRAGDNTVLKASGFMAAVQAEPDKWLGTDGVILGDSGASDGDRLFLNPYHQPTEPDKCHFNFCHSSTRFYVEQTFGIWKSRFRFLLTYMRGVGHKLYTLLIYASAILHNYLVMHRDDIVPLDTAEPHWRRFFSTFKTMRCPECVRAGKAHCAHQALYNKDRRSAVGARKKPSVVRDAMCKELWEREILCEGDEFLRAQMCERAVDGINRDD